MIYAIAITVHFIFDWILQSREIALNKSTDVIAWCNHMGFQAAPYIGIIFISLVFFAELDENSVWEFPFIIVVNCLSHGLIDWYLPKIYPPYNERRMINLTAVDQILHLSILLISIEYLIS